MNTIPPTCQKWYNRGHKTTKPHRSDGAVVPDGVTSAVSGTDTTPFIVLAKGTVLMTTLPPHAQKSKTLQTYSIYQYTHPHTGEILYIGRTSNPRQRFLRHLSSPGPLYTLACDLRFQGIELTPIILETTDDLQESKELEKKWIKANAPKLNQVHNQEEIERRKQEEETSFWAERMGWTRTEAHLYLKHFHLEGGYTYDAIEYATQAARELLGIGGKFTSSEILHIALKYRGIEVKE